MFYLIQQKKQEKAEKQPEDLVEEDPVVVGPEESGKFVIQSIKMTTQEFIETLNDFAGPVSPFDDGDYSDPATIPNIRKKWLAKHDAKEVANCLKEVFIKQPPCFWPDRENIYRLEILEIAGLLKNMVYAREKMTS